MSAALEHGHCAGGKDSRTYRAWINMRRRCRNQNSHNFGMYGGRGISVCSAWDDFPTFLRDMGEPQSGQSLDRIDNNLGYEPANCRWTTIKEQNRNRRVTATATAYGITKPMTAWLEDERCNARTLQILWTRIRLLKWDHERAVSTPSNSYRNRGRPRIQIEDVTP